ncbi:hypothetical protein MTO96_022106 [Rhipicephalus appendiculatus]
MSENAVGPRDETNDETEIAGPSIFRMPVGSFRIMPLNSKATTSFAWKHFGHLTYLTGGKQKKIGTDYYCESCLTKSSNEDDSKPFESCKIKRYASTDFFMKYGVIKELQELPDRTTLSRSALEDVYRAMHGQVKKTVAQGPRFCAVTYDLWTDSYRRRAYITFTCHLVDENFELVSLTLSTRHMSERHTGAAIMSEFQRCVEEFAMEEKEVYAVTDASSNMRRAASLARTEHHLCVGHALHNLVIKDGFGSVPDLHSLLLSCREIVKTVHYRASELEEIADSELNAAIQSLVSTAETLEHDENDPVLDEGCQNNDHAYNAAPLARGGVVTMKLDTPTRWHSILAMFESLLANKAALRRLLARLGHPFPGIEDWSLMEEVVKFLSQFKCEVELFSKQKSCTFNVLIVIRSELLASLKDTSGSSDVQEMKREMLQKFEHRFPLTDAMVTASLLDPRFQNLSAVEEYLAQRRKAI